MIANVNSKGLSIAGALLLSACAQRSERTFHDTYYVVAHGHYALSLLAVALLFALAWAAILKLSRRPMRKHALMAGAAYALGTLLTLAPWFAILIADPVHTDFTLFMRANTIAIAGSLLLLVTLTATAVILIANLITALKRR
jgi:heme/copper-type cytochrome/quinol oxidase subunit 1